MPKGYWVDGNGMMHGFILDNSDPNYPKLARLTGDDAKPFGEAKKELLEEIQSHLRHWHDLMNRYRHLRMDEVERSEYDPEISEDDQEEAHGG